MTDLQLTRALIAHDQREADRELLELPEAPKRMPFAVRMAAHKAAEAAALRRQMIAEGIARRAAA